MRAHACVRMHARVLCVSVCVGEGGCARACIILHAYACLSFASVCMTEFMCSFLMPQGIFLQGDKKEPLN